MDPTSDILYSAYEYDYNKKNKDNNENNITEEKE
jgi:hypothetical protein